MIDLRPPKMRLECMNSFQLYGNVMSLQSVSLAGSQRDALLISFKDAKLSVVQHDPDTFELKTLSLHYYEEEDIKVIKQQYCLFNKNIATFELSLFNLRFTKIFKNDMFQGGWTGNYHIPIVRVDPDNRCAVMLCYGRKLVVLPFRRDNTLDEIEVQDVKPMKKVNIYFKIPIFILTKIIFLDTSSTNC